MTTGAGPHFLLLPRPLCLLLFLLLLLLLCCGGLKWATAEGGFCKVSPTLGAVSDWNRPLYWRITNPTLSPDHLKDLPGFTRSVYRRDHAVITPESHVFSPLPDWVNTLGAYLITPAMGSHFSMYLANMQASSRSALPPQDVERFLFVVEGTAILSNCSGSSHSMPVDSYAYLPANSVHSLEAEEAATLVIFERRYVNLENYVPEKIIGSTEKQPLLETPGEVFALRKLLPASAAYDFNIHV